MRSLLLGGVALLALTAIDRAIAADLPVKTAPVYKAPAYVPLPVYSWTGCYIGGEAGYAWDRSQHTFSNGGPPGTSNPQGALGGGLLGCNYQISNFVIGIEGDYEAADLNGGGFGPILTLPTSAGSARMKSDDSVRGRLGVVVFDRSLLYVTGGWASARYNFTGGDILAPTGGGFSASPNGWTVGAGWEYAFLPSWTARVEYRHADFGSSTGALAPTFPNVNMSVKNTTDAVRVGVTYKFTDLFH
jgi:outer membrane immunogenic protein